MPETANNASFSGCPHCGNQRGFVCSTCIECGYNSSDKTFHSININPEDLPWDMREWAIRQHAARTRKRDR